ncbi:oxidoreductase [Pseudomonas typographi]|uniref:SDR family NAD(P)-dependent oxidoreductase n=1 Tax=Pseudomonas typographi TaxID=2715964 RepID=A0ABR7YWU7_9PSED|nr:oxidoreductase [Pseudomonas typographi]MBD1597609.1 SDR family NAD(P)-dependent oxidoreductase [Pseudomonas typographi]
MAETWFITGAARGLGAGIAEAALAAGHNLVVSSRRLEALQRLLDQAPERVLALHLDVTDEAAGARAVEAALQRFGRVDVLVNNAGYGQLAPFEENRPEDADKQFATNVFGVFNLCRAVLPVMRQQRSGHVFNISSVAGLAGMGGAALYCASKFAVAGFSEALSQEVAQFGIHVTAVEPGGFRTDFLDASSAQFGGRNLGDYAAFTAKVKASAAAGNHQQAGDPLKLGEALLTLAASALPPLHFAAGSDALKVATDKLKRSAAELDQWQGLSRSTDGLSA